MSHIPLFRSSGIFGVKVELVIFNFFELYHSIVSIQSMLWLLGERALYMHTHLRNLSRLIY